MATWTVRSEMRVFAFDVEARPGPWAGSDFTYRHMLSIAGVYEDDISNPIYIPPYHLDDRRLAHFVKNLKNTLVVTHNGPKYDLPFLSGTLMRMGLPPLGRVFVSDTYAHLPRRGAAFSASLGNMAQRFEVEHQKGHMSEVDWDLAYNSDPEALEKLRDYNIGDCVTTLALRSKLRSLGILGAPRSYGY